MAFSEAHNVHKVTAHSMPVCRRIGLGSEYTAAQQTACTHPLMASVQRPSLGLFWSLMLGTPRTCERPWSNPIEAQSSRQYLTGYGSLLALQIQ